MLISVNQFVQYFISITYVNKSETGVPGKFSTKKSLWGLYNIFEECPSFFTSADDHEVGFSHAIFSRKTLIFSFIKVRGEISALWSHILKQDITFESQTLILPSPKIKTAGMAS